MSRQALKDFVHALEHSAGLRRQVSKTSTLSDVLLCARQNGFAVTTDDLKSDSTCERVGSWFARSWIH